MLPIRFPYGMATVKLSVLQGIKLQNVILSKILRSYLLSFCSVLHLRIVNENIVKESSFFLDEAVVWLRRLGNFQHRYDALHLLRDLSDGCCRAYAAPGFFRRVGGDSLG